MQRSTQAAKHSLRVTTALLAVMVTGYFTYFRGYEHPTALFWDENYHIASAQRYLNGIFFLEPHPPLGKMMIALGEKLLHPNSATTQFLDTDYGTQEALPTDFSFAGYRLFPTLLAWFTAPLILLIVLTVTGRLVPALLASALYLFDNSIILHSRAAMLDSTQIFFLMFSLLAFFITQKQPFRRRLYLAAAMVMGGAIGAVIATKINGLHLLVLIPLLWFAQGKPSSARVAAIALASLSALTVYFSVWYLHFNLGRERNPRLAEQGYYSSSPEIKAIVDQRLTGAISSLPRLWKENAIRYLERYATGVPRLDLCKPDENGSPFFLWPIGARAIQYRWESAEGNRIKYLFLVANPVGWGVALLAIVGSISLLFARLTIPGTELTHTKALAVILVLYIGYMFGMAQIARVLYLYHYFFALTLSYLLVPLLLQEIKQLSGLVVGSASRTALAVVIGGATFGSYLWYSPFAYFTPLRDDQVRARALLDLWDLKCMGCPRPSRLATPATATIMAVRFKLGEITPHDVQQTWGTPRLGLSVIGRAIVAGGVSYTDVFGMHAYSELNYNTKKKFTRFTADVGLPDYQAATNASVTFRVEGDGALLWESPVVRGGEGAHHIDLEIAHVDKLTLKILDGGDGITNDHGFWGNPRLIE